MSGIPSDQEMQDFRAELEEVGLSEAARKLNQQVYGRNRLIPKRGGTLIAIRVI